MVWTSAATPNTRMATTDLSGGPASRPEGESLAAGGFVPDASAIERLANAFFQGVTGGAPVSSSPSGPASPLTPWPAPAQPSSPAPASVLPAQPPFVQPDVPTNGVPSSVPYRSLGASAGSASPFAFAQSRAVAPAVSQTAIAAPRADPLQDVEQRVPLRGDASPASYGASVDLVEPAALAVSPFSAPADLSAFRAATQRGPHEPSVGVGHPSGRWPAEAGYEPQGDAVPSVSPARPAVIPTAEALQSAELADPRQGVGRSGSSEEAQQAYELSPFTAPFDLSEARLGWTAAAFKAPPTHSAAIRDLPPVPSASHERVRLPSEPGVAGAPTASAAAAPAAAIAPVFIDASSGTRTFDAASIRNDFPILQEKVHGRRLIWLDNGATTQKPQAVIDRLAAFYAHENSNVHRGAHTLAARATDAYEAARDKVRRFIGASSPNEIVFVRGTTEGINLVAQGWGRRNVKAGDEIVITWLEHHANIVPWQQLCLETGARLRVAPVDDNGDIRLDEYEKLLGPRTRIVALSQVSNALGTVTPAREMIAAAHRHGALALVDGAQSVAHKRTDVQALDADFFVFSGHKMFAPTGIGAIYGKQAILDTTPPWQGGGNMIADVTFERTTYQSAPGRFEAGTGNIADAVGLGAAIDYLDTIGLEPISLHEHELLEQAVAGLREIPGLRLIGAPRERAGVVSFVLDGVRTEDVGKALDREGIAVRAGHHCAQPILRRFGLESTVRPSFALYNTSEDVEALVAAVRRIALEGVGASR
jgi:cysteine desulfurase / selenocysteine lyase